MWLIVVKKKIVFLMDITIREILKVYVIVIGYGSEAYSEPSQTSTFL